MCRRRIVFRRRFSTLWREEADRSEEEGEGGGEEEWPMELEPEEEEIAMAVEGGVFCAIWLWEEDEFVMKRADSG